jgi:non-specific serine/threonine protein kinase
MAPPASHVASARLPTPATPIIGRDRALEDVRSLIAGRPRLVTLTGPGGVGKTRLALEVAEALRGDFSDGVWFVDLSSLVDPQLVLPYIWGILAKGRENGESPLENLVTTLQSSQMLVVLDNCEQVLEAAPELAVALGVCPRLIVLATSRAPLRIRGELEYPVLPLELPRLDQPMRLDAAGKASSVDLFIERVRAVRPDFELNADNAADVAELCVRLDGLPLAIELVAPRLRSMSPAALLERLDSCMNNVGDAPRDVAARQRTMRATVNWSYCLLNHSQQRLFRRLAVFESGFDMFSAEAVCGSGESVVGDLGALVEASLVFAVHFSARTGFGLLETVRTYALEQLSASGELDAVREAHLRHYVSLVEELELRTSGREQVSCLDRLEREHANICAALRWALQQQDVSLGLRLCSALRHFWYVRGSLREGSEWLAGFLSCPMADVDPRLRARALNAAGNLAGQRGAYADAERYHRESLSLRRNIGDEREIAQSLVNLGSTSVARGDFQTAQDLYEESLRLRRSLDDAPGVFLSLENLALLAYQMGQFERARALYVEARALAESLGNSRNIARTLQGLAWVAQQQGHLDEAIGLNHQALLRFHDVGDRSALAECLETIGDLASVQGNAHRGARLLGAAERLWEQAGSTRLPVDHGRYLRSVELVRLRLGDSATDRAWMEGRSMSAQQAVDEALGLLPSDGNTRHAGASGRTRLTRREREVAVLIARGLTNRQIADALVISAGTARIHVDHILAKLAFQSRTQVAAWVVETRLQRDVIF